MSSNNLDYSNLSKMTPIAYKDAAVLLMSLGEEEAANVLKFLSPKEIQTIGEQIVKTQEISSLQLREVLDRFVEDCGNQGIVIDDSGNYVKSILRKALGEKKASLLIDRILQGEDISGIEGLKWLNPSSIAELLRFEHPQIIAATLAHLDYEQVSAVLMEFPERIRNEIVLRIATLEGIQPTALKDLNEVLYQALSGGGEKITKNSIGGVKPAAEIINLLTNKADEKVLNSIQNYDNELAKKIIDKMFIFDDLIKLDDKTLQIILREIQTENLTIALKGASFDLKEKLLSNMAKRAADSLREDLESRGPIKLSEVEIQQKEIVKTVRKLAENGEISLNINPADSFI